MARPLREELPGGIFHVYARGNRGQPIYLDELDKQSYLRLLGATSRRCRWRCLAYCLMDNHVHLVVETPEPNLAVGMRALHGTYAQLFNRRHGLSGHVFQGRYGSVRIVSDEHLWVTLRYVALNPVEAGLCSDPGDYEWSSHGVLARDEASPVLDSARVLSHFEGLGDPVARYRRFVGYALS